MLSLFDYIFYRAYKLGLGRSKAPIAYAAGIVSVSQFFALLTLFAFLKSFFGFSELPNNFIYVVLVVLFLGLNWYRYERNPRLDEMNKRWGDEEQNKKLIRGWVIVFCIAFLVITPFIIAKRDFESRHSVVHQSVIFKESLL